ncbi:MAG: DNA ligase [Candidatus Pristimantibacillus sp.]
MVVQLPITPFLQPMAPISNDQLPQGADWIYQLKWDGVRILAVIGSDGTVQLYSRKLLPKNTVYPEIVQALRQQAEQLGACMLDGEVVYWDGERPNFQKVLQRERSGGVAREKRHIAIGASQGKEPKYGKKGNEGNEGHGGHAQSYSHSHLSDSLPPGLLYVPFDLLFDNDVDLRSIPYIERYKQLQQKLLPIQSEWLLLTDMYTDGDALWQWVEQHRWEGIVSKRLSSPYREGKNHRDWLKKKTALLLNVGIVGVKRRDGRAASLVMADQEGNFIGSVSLGLDEAMRGALGEMLQLRNPDAPSWTMPFAKLPGELKGEDVIWLPSPMPCRVTGLELTSAGLLRHPKLVSFGVAASEEGGSR